MKTSMQAESPDEASLALGAAVFGKLSMVDRTPHAITLACGEELGSLRVKILAVNEFDSDRKRMSIVVQLPDGRFTLWVKGADSSMFPLSKVDQTVLSTKEAVNYFSSEGLRTLVFAKRELTREELFGLGEAGQEAFDAFQASSSPSSDIRGGGWMDDYHDAISSVKDRRKRLAAVAESIEKRMTVLGCVGIQDELATNVGETIDILKEAGIKIWMLTGDKAETAISVGRACHLIPPSTPNNPCDVEKLTGMTDENELRQRLQDILYSLISSQEIDSEEYMASSVNLFRANKGSESSKQTKGNDQNTVSSSFPFHPYSYGNTSNHPQWQQQGSINQQTAPSSRRETEEQRRRRLEQQSRSWS